MAQAQRVQAMTGAAGAHQLGLYGPPAPAAPRPRVRRGTGRRAMCAGCRAREARYGFSDDEQPDLEGRPRALCFECFRLELDRRQAVRARLARGWHAQQVGLPLDERLRELTRRRRRAQIAARHALDTVRGA